MITCSHFIQCTRKSLEDLKQGNELDWIYFLKVSSGCFVDSGYRGWGQARNQELYFRHIKFEVPSIYQISYWISESEV